MTIEMFKHFIPSNDHDHNDHDDSDDDQDEDHDDDQDKAGWEDGGFLQQEGQVHTQESPFYYPGSLCS